MGYKEDFKRKEMEHELRMEDEERWKTMSKEEIRKELIEEAKAAAYRYNNPR